MAPKVKLMQKEVDKPEILPPVEEHVILRIQDLKLAATIKALVKARDPVDNLSITFKEPRRCTLKYEDAKYRGKLVDLPCILESQKTFDNRQLYKICDISQMIVVDESPSALQPIDSKRSKDSVDEFVWPHGISAPLKYVRKRRFRKRISKRAIENVEREVERLLQADAEAEDIRYEEVLETQDFEEEGQNSLASNLGTLPNNADETGTGAMEDFDDDFAAELENALEEEGLDGDDGGEEEEEEEDLVEDEEEDPANAAVGSDDEEGSEDEEDDIEDDETRALKEEINELETTIAEKQQQVQEQMNPIIRARIEGIVRKLSEELVRKRAALSVLST